jgi:hypothetical protein
MINMKLTTVQLAEILHMQRLNTYRFLMTINLPRKKRKSIWEWELLPSHPLYQSLQHCTNDDIKPFYTINELSKMMTWRGGRKRGGKYTRRGFRDYLIQHDIPIQNQSGKGFVWLIDLIPLTE